MKYILEGRLSAEGNLAMKRGSELKEQSPELKAKLNKVRIALATLTAEDLEYLVSSTQLVEQNFGVVGPENARARPVGVKAYLSKKRPFPNHQYSAVVESSPAQREQARKIALDNKDLSKVRGKRIDPFSGRDDPEPTSDEEE